uniref:Uncharacterized protein n=1 Tax=Romanomermis culicivorax TaxID=13658 RepID=A0A915ING0_ROMCU
MLDPATTLTTAHDHCSSFAIANANEVQNFGLEVSDSLKQLNTAAARITNKVPTVQTINQIIGALSDQFQAQQLGIQCKIQEQAQATNARFVTLAENATANFNYDYGHCSA